jgi:N-acyl-D-aspartate/D-glutamate deacylase
VVGLAQRAATDDELRQMRELASLAMEAGAWGMSTGLIYVPSSYANTAEIATIAEVVGRSGGLYASHIRGEGIQLLVAVQEALDIGAQSGCPVHVSHFKASGQDAWGLVQRAAELIEQARQQGRKVTADQYPYIASSTSLEATLLPSWARAGGSREMLARLDDPESGPRIREAIGQALQNTEGGGRIRLARYSGQPRWAGKSLAELAAERQTQPLEIVLEILRGGGAAVVNFGMREEDVRFVMALPWVATASDGRAYLPGADRPHPRSYGTFPRKIGHYAQRERVLSLEQAIRSATSLPASILGLTDRGEIAPERVADLVVFDPERFIDQATYDDPHAYAGGVRHVFVAGEPAVWKGSPTGALRGRALRRPPVRAAEQPRR